MEKEHLDYYQTVVNTQRNAEILKAELQDLINLIKLENSSPVEPEVSDANGDPLHQFRNKDGKWKYTSLASREIHNRIVRDIVAKFGLFISEKILEEIQ